MCVQNFMEIALCVLEFGHLVQNGPLPQTLEAGHSQSGRSMKNLKYPFLSNGYRDTVCWFAWFLDEKWRSTVQKCVLDKSACWWRCNRPMWKVGGLGASAAPRECACTVSLPSCQPSLRFGVHKNRIAHGRTDARTDGRTHGRGRKHSLPIPSVWWRQKSHSLLRYRYHNIKHTLLQ